MAHVTRNEHALPRWSGPVGEGASRVHRSADAIGHEGILGPMQPLDPAALHAELATCPGWALSGGQIERTYGFPDFLHSMRFVNELAAEAERVQHHPDILVRYSRVTLSLSTHDAGGITGKDFAFARFADRVRARMGDA
jgi:4a-hydroxytetrahydrobiopterin dehydratase